MRLADKKRKENIIEYVLFLFHTEDLMRSFNMDLTQVKDKLIEPNASSPAEAIELEEWYGHFIEKMKKQEVVNEGHIEEVHELMNELFYLHLQLINVFQHKQYQEAFDEAKSNIEELQNKTMGKTKNPIETCFHGIYAVLLLKIKKKQISEATSEAIQTFRDMLNILSAAYKDIQAGKQPFRPDINN
jgi:hypothetical protein